MQRAFLARAVPSGARAALLPRMAPRALAQPQFTAKRWNQQAPAESHIFDEHDATRRRLLYRSKQRGWLEMDLMLGAWVRARPVLARHAIFARLFARILFLLGR